MTLQPVFTDEELLLVDAAAALRLAQEMAQHHTQPDTTDLQSRLMERVHQMRAERLGVRLSYCGISS